MDSILMCSHKKTSDPVFILLCVVAASLLLVGFLTDTPENILDGLGRILSTPAGLITDSIVVGGMGAAFVNAGLVTLLSLSVFHLSKVTFSGLTIACIFLMSGFALFGKDILNIMPILLGSYLYSLFMRQAFAKFIYAAFFGTTLSPIVSEFAHAMPLDSWICYLIAMLIGVSVGFLIPPLSSFTIGLHRGYNLYNVGFAAGLLSMLVISISRAFGVVFTIKHIWSSGNNLLLSAYCFSLFSLFIASGFYLNGRSFKGFKRVMTHPGRAYADFVMLEGFPLTLVNIGVCGILGVLYILAVGGDLNGPTLSGIFALSGFGAFGKHLKNTVPLIAGCWLFAVVTHNSPITPSLQIAALFVTGLAPVAGQFGAFWGIITGFVHAAIVMNITVLHGGLNLYNNGFAGGLAAILLIPIMQIFRKDENI